MFGDRLAVHARWLLLGLAVFSLFFLLGGRSLNEPDEGRYAEIAREMLETGDWLVPHFWYAPHLDKPPLAYWAVAASMSVFGQNEWAVRLPLALAGLSGLWAAYLLAVALGGPRAGRWTVLILLSSLLYFVMARMLTPDIFLTQFVAWAIYFFWRGWQSLGGLEQADESVRARAGRRFFLWHLAAWAAMAGGFLTKGPIAVIIPLLALAGLGIYGRKDSVRWKLLVLGGAAGLPVFALIIAPWFALLAQAVPAALDYMVFGQVIGHTLGTTIKNRQGSPFYFVAILAVGFLPWSVLVGWLWRRAHWRGLAPERRAGWVLASVWVLGTVTIFTLIKSKLPAYILPLFPALAVLTAVRWFAEGNGAEPENAAPPAWLWRVVLVGPLLVTIAVPLALRGLFQVTDSPWFWPQLTAAVLLGAVLGWRGRTWAPARCAGWAAALSLLNLLLLATQAPAVETALKSNQTLKPLGLALRREWRAGDRVVCWGRLPQGLPFYAYPAISAINRPYLGGMALNHVPFESTGNPERFHDWMLPDAAALDRLLTGPGRIWVVATAGTFAQVQARLTQTTGLREVTRAGRWELFVNR